ncbi:cation diffusion facilitator family transporter [Streptomyces sp. NPDC050428]|uniref:cation diffusion facilitator family transporter n=1 Tax=Streptomyces sp. NPDC050428 TaxID=3155757 RepID=UPI0034293CC1
MNDSHGGQAHTHEVKPHAHEGHGDHGHDHGGHDHGDHGHDHGDHGHDHGDHGHGDHGHDHGDHGHDHGGGLSGLWHSVSHLVTPHSHESADKIDPALESSAKGMRALWVSLAVLGVTAIAQVVVVILSGSVALLGDTVHNAADALTALPLAVAFLLGRRAATRKFTYGYGRAEDIAGIVIVLTIAASAVFAAWTAIDRLFNPQEISYLPAVAVAAVVGFIGNEWVARYRIRVGREIGSAALIADGLHARTDGFTSLAVLLGAGGAAIGWNLADPIIGLLITAAIVLVLRDATREVFRRIMDAVDPALVDTAEQALVKVPGVRSVGELRMRWIGHRLRAEVSVVVAGDLTVRQAHHVAVEAEHALLHAVPKLTAAMVHSDPAATPDESDPHEALHHHEPILDHRAPAPAHAR